MNKITKIILISLLPGIAAYAGIYIGKITQNYALVAAFGVLIGIPVGYMLVNLFKPEQ